MPKANSEGAQGSDEPEYSIHSRMHLLTANVPVMRDGEGHEGGLPDSTSCTH